MMEKCLKCQSQKRCDELKDKMYEKLKEYKEEEEMKKKEIVPTEDQSTIHVHHTTETARAVLMKMGRFSAKR